MDKDLYRIDLSQFMLSWFDLGPCRVRWVRTHVESNGFGFKSSRHWSQVRLSQLESSGLEPLSSRVDLDSCWVESTRFQVESNPLGPRLRWVSLDPYQIESSRTYIKSSRAWPISTRVDSCPCQVESPSTKLSVFGPSLGQLESIWI